MMEKTLSFLDMKNSVEVENMKLQVISFCDFIETFEPETEMIFLVQLQKNLLTLYQAGLNLGWIDLESDVDYEEELNKDELEKTFHFTAQRLPIQYYWEIFDPHDKTDNQAVCGDLLDDIIDIYKDIKSVLLILHIGTEDSIGEAIWQFKFYFQAHWGDHCINALRAIHHYLQKNYLL